MYYFLEVKMSFTLKCNNCGKTKSFPCSELEWEVVDSNERQMGAETCHEAVFETSCDNSWEGSDIEDEDVDTEECGGITVTFTCYEYPVGSVNLGECNASGAEVIENNCSCDVSFDESVEDDE